MMLRQVLEPAEEKAVTVSATQPLDEHQCPPASSHGRALHMEPGVKAAGQGSSLSLSSTSWLDCAAFHGNSVKTQAEGSRRAEGAEGPRGAEGPGGRGGRHVA